LNLVVTGGLVVLIPIVCVLLTPRDSAACEPPRPEQLAPLPALDVAEGARTVDRIQESRWFGAVAGAVGMAVLAAGFATGRLSVDLNTVVLLFLFAGIALHGSLLRYGRAIADGARGAAAIVLQFPFYFGILGLMKASGLIVAISENMAAIASARTFPIVAFLSAGLVNLFIPSGGGQWAVQGEVLLSAGASLGVDPRTTIMAFSYGDAWTNLLQPFWALPLLGIMGLRARDIIGYTAVVLLVMAIWVPACLLLLG
jgi:short-chain fatty acids transporter